MSPSFESTVARCISVSILLWRDATPNSKFPPMNELVSIEITRLLGEDRLFRAVPGLYSALKLAGVAPLLLLNPWEVNPKEFLTSYKQALSAQCLQEVQKNIEEEGYKDVVLSMIKTHNKPQTNSKDTISKVARAVCQELGINEEQNAHDVAIQYNTIYTDIVRV